MRQAIDIILINMIQTAYMASNEKDITPIDTSDGAHSPGFFAFLEGMGYKDMDPLSPEALKLQAEYIKTQSQHPLDILKRLSTNPFCSPNERISACKALMQYTMRAVPSNLELTGKDGGPIMKFDAKTFANLTDDELEVLQTLLAKANSKEVANG